MTMQMDFYNVTDIFSFYSFSSVLIFWSYAYVSDKYNKKMA